ncbi:MAG: glutamine synthetase family protein [Desulfobacteraceae bacterium]
MSGIEGIKRGLAQAESTKIFFADLNGRLMSLPVNPENIERLLDRGIGFDGSSIAGYASVESSDRILIPDPESFLLVPSRNGNLGFFVGLVYNEHGDRSQADPRAILERVVAEGENRFGCRFTVGPEHEFFLLNSAEWGDGIHTDKAGYFHATPHDQGETVRNEILAVLKACGIRFEKAHHEVTPSQHEINLEATEPLKAADRTLLFNYVTQQTAAAHGYHATFMPKPFDGQNRSAFHIHLSMQDLEGRNLFWSESGEGGLSETALHFIGGILRHGRGTSLVMASTFNSYKAYVLEREAPVVRSWGFRNRSSMVRVPYSSAPENVRIELRSPDPAGNVYLQLATLIAMGLDGIENRIHPGKPDSGSTYRKGYGAKVWDRRFLPKTLFEALVEAERSRFLRELLGERVYRNYMALKTRDWEEHRTHVTPREHKKYL